MSICSKVVDNISIVKLYTMYSKDKRRHCKVKAVDLVKRIKHPSAEVLLRWMTNSLNNRGGSRILSWGGGGRRNRLRGGKGATFDSRKYAVRFWPIQPVEEGGGGCCLLSADSTSVGAHVCYLYYKGGRGTIQSRRPPALGLLGFHV